MRVTGSGGGGSKGGGASVAPNTLRSNTLARIVELLGEGEIEGLVAGAQSIFFNETPLQNADGTYNFGGLFTYNSDTGTYDPVTTGTTLTGDDVWIPGVSWDARTGLPDQAVLNGYASSETTTSVEEQIKFSIGPIIRTIEDETTNAVKVVIRVPNLSYLDPGSGDLNAASVSWIVEVAPSGGDYVLAEAVALVNQKCTSPYEYQTLVQMPAGGAPWNIRVTRTCADSTTDINLQNDTWWESYTEVVQGQFIYPNTALVALTMSAEYFGSSIPKRGYHVKGLKTDIPSNWDPITRVYTGVWDGTFVTAWHNNPAWVFYALLTNSRWGIGEFVDPSIVDKWGLYQIATYCDELVPSGYFNPDGSPIMEPRFVYNGVINTREEAYKVLQTVCAAFRGMAFWSLGQVFAVADMPTDAITTLSPANVIGGHFNYSGTGMKSRHSVAMVSWNDPTDFYRPTVEVVQNDDMIQRFGWRQIDVVAPGCTSRGQATRFGKWILDTEEHETETVDFQMSWSGYILEDGKTLKPGDIILVADPRKTGGARIGGRLDTVASTSVMTIDAPFAPGDGESYTLTVMMPDGTVETQPITSFDDTNTILTLTNPLSALPEAGTMWVIQGTDVTPRQYRVLSVQEQDSHIFKISALFNDPTKYARVEENLALATPVYTRPPNVMAPPSNATAVESNYFTNGAPQSRVTLSWTAPAGALASKYHITADSPRGAVDFGTTASLSIDLFNIVPGDWVFYVAAISYTGLQSINLPSAITVHGWSAADTPTAGSLEILGGGTIYTGTAPTISWVNTFPDNSVAYALQNVVRVYDADTNDLLRTETVSGTTYTYSLEDNINDGGPRRALTFTVTAMSLLGVEQSDPATTTVTNPSPAAVTPIVTSVDVSIDVKWTVADNDYFKSIVWISPTNGFDPLITPPVYEGPDTATSVVQITPGIYYVRVGAYDQFGKTGMNIGPQIAVTCTGTDIEAFNTQLADYITNQISTMQSSIEATQGIIATAASEQDAANAIDKSELKSIISANFDTLNGTLTAQASEIATVGADAASALAAYEITVTASLGDLTADVSTNSTAIATVGGKLADQWMVTLDVNGFMSGIQAYNDGSTANMTIIADNFQIASPAHINGASSAVTISIATPGLISWPAHGFSVGQQVKFATTGALPTGIVAGVWYYVIAAGLVAGAFQISATLGGAAINTSGTQSGVHTGTANGGGLPVPMFTASTVNGVPQIVMAGVMIGDGTITAPAIAAGSVTAAKMAVGSITAANAAIDLLAVKSLNIGDNAVTVPLTQVLTTTITGTGFASTPINISSVTLSVDSTGLAGKSITVLIGFFGQLQYSASSVEVYTEIRVNGTLALAQGQGGGTPSSINLSTAYTYVASGGVDSIAVNINWNGDCNSGAFNMINRTLWAMAAKR
jgi:predicted phage tail protein